MIMNKLTAIRALCLRKDFWDHHLANMQLAKNKCMARGRFDVQKKKWILERDYHFFAAVLLEIDLDNVYTREA